MPTDKNPSPGPLAATAESQTRNGQPPSWLEQLRPATFRGVPFQVDTIEWTAGDHVVVREYPFQDLPTVFRMGAVAQEIHFSAYVIGDDYHLQRDKLMQALTGEGELVHPTAGTLRVHVAGKFKVTEAPATEGGLARFDLTFVLAEQRRYAGAGANHLNKAALDKASSARAAAKDGFASRWRLAGQPGWLAEAAVGRVRDTLSAVTGKVSSAARFLNDFNAEVNASYRAVTSGLESLVQAPRQLADAVQQLVRLPSDLSRSASREFRAAFAWAADLKLAVPRKPFEVARLAAPGLPAVYGTGVMSAVPAEAVQQRALAALTDAADRLVETMAVAAYVEVVARTELVDYDEALAVRAELGALLATLQGALSEAPAAPAALDAPDAPAASWHGALAALQGAALADLQARSRSLVRLTTYTPEAWQPAVYVSHRLYGTGEYAAEILAMNPHVTHPLLVPPGRPLRVMRRD